MNKHNHFKITELALGDTELCLHAIDRIGYANQDSDHQSSPAGMASQHYCGPDTTDHIVLLNKHLIDESLNIAALLTRRSGEEELVDALYFLGRAFHCVQDFYAHSNWIAIGRREVWHGKSAPPNLKFCGATPKLAVARNAKIFGKNWWKGRTKTYRNIVKPYRSKSDNVWHPNMHLDFEGSWAEMSIKKVTGQPRAYQEAERLAVQHTKEYWNRFSTDLVFQEQFNPASQLGKDKWANFLAKVSHKQRYADRHNEAGTDPRMALRNLVTFDPGLTKRRDHQIENSRTIFQNYFCEPWSYGPWKQHIKLLDKVSGWDAAIC